MGSRKVFLAKLSFAVGVVARNKFKSIGNLINRQANKNFAEMFFCHESSAVFFFRVVVANSLAMRRRGAWRGGAPSALGI